MKTALGFLTEEGRTKRKNTIRRICVYATVMFLVASASGYVIHRYWVSPSLTTLQRVYFKQYAKATFRSYSKNSRSRYTTLNETVRDPGSGKDYVFPASDEHIDPVLSQDGRIMFDESHNPKFQLKPNMEEVKRLGWDNAIVNDLYAYGWFKRMFYDGKSILDIWRPAWLSSLLLFISGMVFLIALDVFANRRYLKGEPLRGTKELSPKKYARKHRKDTGIAVTAYRQESET
jgi:hypothetical protein